MSSAPRNPFHLPDYRRWFFASTFLSISGGTTLATSLLLVDMTGSPLVAGTIVGVLTAVDLLATLLGGGLADRISRRRLINRLMRTSAVINLILVVTIALIILGDLQGNTGALIAVVGALILTEGLLGATKPALDAALKKVISPKAYPRALSAANARESTVSLVGGPVTGLLYGLAAWLPYLLRTACQVAFQFSLRGVRTDFGPDRQGEATAQQPASDVGERPAVPAPSVAGYREAFSFLWSDGALRRFLLAAPLVNVMVSTMGSWLVFSLRGEGLSAGVVGLVVAGLAVGTLAGSAVTPSLSDRVPPGRLAIAGLASMTVVFAAMPLAPHTPVVLFALGCLAMLPSPALNAGIFTYVFRQTPNSLQGRVTATFTGIAGAVYAVGPALAGVALSVPATTAVLLGTCALAGVGVLLLVSSAAVRGMN